MLELFSALQASNIPTIFIIFGLIGLFVSVGLRFNQITVTHSRPLFLGVLSIFCVLLGVILFFTPYLMDNAENKNQLTSKTLYEEDFTVKRNDGLRLFETDEVSFTTKIQPHYYDVKINTGKIDNDSALVRLLKIPGVTVDNFDLFIDFREIIGETKLSVHFRQLEESKIYFDLFTNGIRRGEYYISTKDKLLDQGKISFDSIQNLRINCIDETCKLFLNFSPNPFVEVNKLLVGRGEILLGFSGNGSIQIDEIRIEELTTNAISD